MAGVYLHIPFCNFKCPYCNFFSVASKRHLEDIGPALIREMKIRSDYLSGETVNTIYFGGGTPSLLDPAEIANLINAVTGSFKVSSSLEITLEANPEHINQEYLKDLAATGVNRISLGLQSLYDDALLMLGRSHDAAIATNALDLIKNGPIKETSVDIIYGIPALTDEMLIQELSLITAMGIPHISAYALTVEERTPLEKLVRTGKFPAVTEIQAARQFGLVMQKLRAEGYRHYEISNYCKPGHHSRHNSAYWDGSHYLGLGPAAHSYDGKSRQWNPSGITQYFDGLRKGKIDFEREILTAVQQFNEMIMTRLRTDEGLNPSEVEATFGADWTRELLKSVQPMIGKKWIVEHSGKILLTDAGKLQADGIAARLFREE